MVPVEDDGVGDDERAGLAEERVPDGFQAPGWWGEGHEVVPWWGLVVDAAADDAGVEGPGVEAVVDLVSPSAPAGQGERGHERGRLGSPGDGLTWNEDAGVLGYHSHLTPPLPPLATDDLP